MANLTAKQHKFKVGDKVLRLPEYVKENMVLGTVYTVIEVSNRGEEISIEGINRSGRMHQWDCLVPERFIHVRGVRPIKRNTNIRR